MKLHEKPFSSPHTQIANAYPSTSRMLPQQKSRFSSKFIHHFVIPTKMIHNLTYFGLFENRKIKLVLYLLPSSIVSSLTVAGLNGSPGILHFHWIFHSFIPNCCRRRHVRLFVALAFFSRWKTEIYLASGYCVWKKEVFIFIFLKKRKNILPTANNLFTRFSRALCE